MTQQEKTIDLTPKITDEDVPAIADPWTGNVFFETVVLYHVFNKWFDRWPASDRGTLVEVLRDMADSLEEQRGFVPTGEDIMDMRECVSEFASIRRMMRCNLRLAQALDKFDAEQEDGK